MKIYTIGYSQKSAAQFFYQLKQIAGLSKIIDVRLNNSSQLAGFTKKDSLDFFLKEILAIDYIHLPILAPTKKIFSDYKNKMVNWTSYTEQFLQLMEERSVETQLNPKMLDNSCLLCSEHSPEHCHRRLIVEYLSRHWENLEILHI
jgi:uncharacterized protein (DUF488 family)